MTRTVCMTLELLIVLVVAEIHVSSFTPCATFGRSPLERTRPGLSHGRGSGTRMGMLKHTRRAAVSLLPAPLLFLVGSPPVPASAEDKRENGREFSARTMRRLLAERGGASVLKFNEPQRLLVEAWTIITSFYLYQDFELCGGRAGWAKVLEEGLDALEKSTEASEAHLAIANRLLPALGDRYSQFLLPEEEDQADEIAAGQEVVGLGAIFVLPPGSKRPKVLTVKEGSDAERAGLAYGDTLLAINGRRVGGEDGQDAGALIPGREGTKVTARLQSPQRGEYSASLTRIPMRMQPLKCKLVTCAAASSSLSGRSADGGGSVVKAGISTFLGPPIAMKQEIERLTQGPGLPKALVLDLRGNTGGSLKQAEQVFKDISSFNFERILALVDKETASAAEYLLDRLMSARRESKQENVRVLGADGCVRTFGKGEAQAKFELSDSSAVEFTVSRFLPEGFIGVLAEPLPGDVDPAEVATCTALARCRDAAQLCHAR